MCSGEGRWPRWGVRVEAHWCYGMTCTGRLCVSGVGGVSMGQASRLAAEGGGGGFGATGALEWSVHGLCMGVKAPVAVEWGCMHGL